MSTLPLRSHVLARRARTIARLLLLAVLALPLAPVLFALALAIDGARFLSARRRFMSLRVLAFGFVYLGAELAGLAMLALDRSLDGTYRVQTRWAYALYAAVRSLFGLRFVVTGDEVIGEAVRPVILVRHTSIVDSLLPTIFVTRAHGLRLRFVLKRELLEDPCLDVAGSRLPNHFVARARDQTGDDLLAIRALAAGLAADEGALIYPEGTRFTAAKRERALRGLALDAPALLEAARGLEHLLPPKPAGVAALLDGAPTADVIFMAHDGLEGFASVSDVWSGALVGRTVRVHMWRVARADIPDEARARTKWLYREWQRMDAWLR